MKNQLTHLYRRICSVDVAASPLFLYCFCIRRPFSPYCLSIVFARFVFMNWNKSIEGVRIVVITSVNIWLPVISQRAISRTCIQINRNEYLWFRTITLIVCIPYSSDCTARHERTLKEENNTAHRLLFVDSERWRAMLPTDKKRNHLQGGQTSRRQFKMHNNRHYTI